MAVMTPSEWVDYYEASAPRIVDLTSANMDEPVPSCPGWAGRDLLRHVGRAPTIWNIIMDTPPGGGFPKLDWDQLSAAMPVDDQALAAWARVETSRYAGSLRQCDPDRWAWSIGPNTTAWMWMRRAAAEMAVHLWDAESIAGPLSEVPSGLAADGLDELTETLPIFLARSTSPAPAPVTAVATDLTARGRSPAPQPHERRPSSGGRPLTCSYDCGAVQRPAFRAPWTSSTSGLVFTSQNPRRAGTRLPEPLGSTRTQGDRDEAAGRRCCVTDLVGAAGSGAGGWGL